MSGTPGSAVGDVITAAYRLHAEIVAAGDAVAGRFGLSAARWQVLGAIALKGETTVPDLASLIGTVRQSVQRIVSELIAEGLVVLADNPRHRRSKLIGLTARGRQAYDAVMASWAPHAAMLEEQSGPEASRILAREMTALAETFRDIADRSNQCRLNDGMISSNAKGANNEP